MKRKIFLVLILVTLSVPSQAQFLKKAFNALKNVAGAVLVGVVDAAVDKSGDSQLKENWNTLKESSDIVPSYASDAAKHAMNGDWGRATIAAASVVAEEAGVSSDLVALGNSGLNNWVNGDKNAAVIGATQLAAHATGHYEFDYYMDSQRQFNQIRREYRDNIVNGMSKEEADRIRIDKISEVIVDFGTYLEEQSEERRNRFLSRKNEVKKVLTQRGYSQTESDFLSNYFAIEDFENDDDWRSNIEEELNNHNVITREEKSSDGFFNEYTINDDDIAAPIDTETEVKDSNPIEPPIEESQPVNDEREKIVKEISETILSDYACGSTALSDSQKKVLDSIAIKLSQYSDISVRIIGHTCNIGSVEVNKKVGERRSKNAQLYLIKQGVEDSRVEIESRGFSEPMVENDTEQNRKKNRRITFEVK